MRKFMMAGMLVVAMLFLTGCEKEKQEKKLPEYGFREYSVDPEDESKRRLVEEFENLGTETTRKTYGEDGNVIELTKEYFDSTGEHLLKEVRWTSNHLTKSVEYDMLGRCIRIQEKQEDGYDPMTEGGLALPEDYRYADKVLYENDFLSFYWALYDFTVDPSIRELRTEIAYKGDTKQIASIQTVTETGETVGFMEFGDEDTILSAMLNVDEQQFEETYDAQSRTGAWKFTSDQTGGSQKEYFGEKDYDASGRCIRYTAQSISEGYWEKSFQYEADGYWETFRHGDNREDSTILHRYYYDYRFEEYAESVSFYEWYQEDESGGTYLIMTCEIDRDDSGREIAQTYRYYDQSGRQTHTVSDEYEYFENGNESKTLCYKIRTDGEESGTTTAEQRELTQEIISIVSEQPGLGKTTQTITKYYSTDGVVSVTNDIKEVSLPYMYDRTTIVDETFDSKSYYHDSEIPREIVTPVFDEEGRLRETREYSYSYEVGGKTGSPEVAEIQYKKFNEQGLCCEEWEVDLSSGLEEVTEHTVWEHWER